MTVPEIPALTTRADVAELLGVELKVLTWWIFGIEHDRRYVSFEIKRWNGEPRHIYAPIQPLKELQRSLATLLADWYRPRPHVHGFTKGRCIASNAERHRRQAWVLKVDLGNFFPSISYSRVRGLFSAFPFDCSPEVANLLASLCCHGNMLPQGAPTSPIISNFICRGLDRDLAKLATRERCYFTRYADDLTFSTDRSTFPAALATNIGGHAAAGPWLQRIVEASGFWVNPDKTRLIHRSQRQRVTGLVVNDKVNVPRDYVRDLRNLLHIWDRYGESAAVSAYERSAPPRNAPPGKPETPFRLAVRGRVQYVGSVKGWNDPVYRRLAEKLANCDPEFRIRPLASSQLTVYLYTEGESDIQHLLAALDHFHAAGEFLDMKFLFGSDSACGGDKELAARLIALPPQRPSNPTACLFDRDMDAVLRQVGLHDHDWVDRGNGVFGAALVQPPFRDGPFCIEMLYPDIDLNRRDADGRRVYLRSEFDEKTGHHLKESCSVANIKNTTLVRDDVYEFGTDRSLAMSKSQFAAAVANQTAPHDGVSFDGFGPTFEMLLTAARAIADKVDVQSGRP